MNNDFNIDDILSEFDSSVSSAPSKAPEQEEQPKPTAPRRTTDTEAHREAREKARAAADAVRREREEPKPERPKKKKARKLPGAVTGLCFLALALCVVWGVFNIHPYASVTVRKAADEQSTTAVAATASPAPTATPAGDGGETTEADAQPEPTEEPVIEAVHYTIPEDAVAGPRPNSSCFGSVATSDAAKIDEVIQQARDYGLLGEDETMVFRSDLDFYDGMYYEDIKYYLDETLLVICWKENYGGCCVSCSEIKIADGSQIRRKLVGDTFGNQQTSFLSDISVETNAVVAMNADFYLFRNIGISVYDRNVYRYSDTEYTTGFKMYNCIDNCFVTADGDFIFAHYKDEMTQEELEQFIADNDIIFSLAFGPVLVENGVLNESYWEDGWYPVGEITTEYSRAGIGQVDKLHYFYMTNDHAETAARWTVRQFAEYMYEKGVYNAYALDGGQTGELVFNHEVYNHVDFGTERLVSDMIYFATALPEE